MLVLGRYLCVDRCADLQEVTDTAIPPGIRFFIGSTMKLCKDAMGAGFVLGARFQENRAAESRVSSSAVNSRRIQNGVRNSGRQETTLHPLVILLPQTDGFSLDPISGQVRSTLSLRCRRADNHAGGAIRGHSSSTIDQPLTLSTLGLRI